MPPLRLNVDESEELVGIALAFGHFGSPFHGSQVQPSLVTVQGTLIEALKRLNWLGDTSSSTPVKMASRTDAGVSVRMNVAHLLMRKRIWDEVASCFLNVLNEHLPPELVVWAAEPVTQSWNPRRAKSRTYLYRLETLDGWVPTVTEAELKPLLNLFMGEHDFSAFSRIEEDRSSVRTIDEIAVWEDVQYDELEQGRIIGFKVKSRGFLWNQVRRMAGAIIEMLNGQLPKEQVIVALNQGSPSPISRLAPPNWLILWAIEYENGLFSDKSDLPINIEHTLTPPITDSDLVRGLWKERAVREQEILLFDAWADLLT